MLASTPGGRAGFVLLWGEDRLQTLATALQRTRDGSPSVLVIEGEAGVGKSALLDELVNQAEDFRVLVADGVESDRAPFLVLRQWGVVLPPSADGGASDPFVAAQGLRTTIDAESLRAPVLLLLDDLHWADPESVEALTWLLRRLSGDRLLVAVGTRPLAAQTHPGWQRWVRDHAERLRLNGLTLDDTMTLARSSRPQITRQVVERLWDHTSGNPFYLKALPEEYEPDQLHAMRLLPAPSDYSRVLAGQLARLSTDAVTLIRAAAALGSGWLSLFDVTAVSDIVEPGTPAQELTDSGLLHGRFVDGLVSVRISHALVRAAVYHQTPMPLRRILHTRAASVVATEGAVLEHRMAAAQQYDEDLARSMESYARREYAKRSFRLAALHLRWSSALTPEPRLREKRWLESLFCRILDGDRAAVHAEAERIRQADDAAGRSLVLGTLAVWERRRRQGIELLEPVALLPLDAVDPALRYRIEVVLAWARIGAGHPTPLIAGSLIRAAQVRQTDAGMSGVELISAGLIQVRQHGFDGVLDELSALPDDAALTPLAATSLLAWRGTARARLGLTREAIRDLSEVAGRIQEGVTDLGNGSFHAFLGYAQWLNGDWGQARLNFGLGSDIAGPGSHPMLLALAPLSDVGDGHFAAADSQLRRAEELLTAGPWLEASQSLLMGRVVRLHAEGRSSDQRRLLPSLRGTPLDPVPMTHTDPLVVVHATLAAVWAHDQIQAERFIATLTALPSEAGWLPAVRHWLSALVAELDGRTLAALTLLNAATADQGDDLPLYRAHMLSDQARVAHRLGERAVAATSLQRAELLYRRLGAVPYLERLAAQPARSPATGGSREIRIPLTDREKDVLALLVVGKSYAQIARELFITQKTVSYHLGNVYAKTGISSRHRLAEFIRAEPHAFGSIGATS